MHVKHTRAAREDETLYGEREEVGQSTSNDAALSTEQATADVYTPNNISRAANNPPIPHDEGSRRTAGWNGNYKICRVDPPARVEVFM